jgi:2'-5' RNA ligase
VDRLQELRVRYDAKTACVTDPHVTLAGTYWRTGPATVENEAEMIARLSSMQTHIAPFDLIVGGIGSFLPQRRVIYLEIEQTAGLMAARRMLMEAIGQDKHRPFTPHLTLVMRLGEVETYTLLDELRQTEWHTQRWSFPIDHLWLMQRGARDPAWRYIYRVGLQGLV